jgi:hypothetical protein
MNNLSEIVQLLKKEQDRLTRELRGIGAALAAFGKAYGKGTRTGRLSATRRKVAPARAKRTMSPAARRKISAAQKARWARVKAGKKTT